MGSLQEEDPRILSDAGHVLSHFETDHGQARTALDRALRLNPNSVPVLNRAGFVYYHCGEPDAAIISFERVMRLNPLDPEMEFVLGEHDFLWGVGDERHGGR